MTRVNGYLHFHGNLALLSIDLSALVHVSLALSVQSNPALTFFSAPVLAFIGDRLFFCQNSPMFEIPTVPNAPLGGLQVSGLLKGTSSCILKQGDQACQGLDLCP
jgi:hypothetical protein